ncbi:MAG: hypothetical protein U0W24_06035 [Bacteroidales bacterium]
MIEIKRIHEKLKVSDFIKLIPFFLFFTLLTWLVSDHIFFGDTIQLGAKHGLFFYENNFSAFLLPDNLDSGHIPAFGMYLAVCWKIFGKSLWVSHFAILPFLIGIVWQSFILLRKYIHARYIYYALALFLADATFLSQATLVSPDIILIFFFLLGLNAIVSNKKNLILIAFIGLALISMRGMMIILALITIDLISNVKFDSFKSALTKLSARSLIYLPSVLVILSFLIYHYFAKGWMGYHKNSPWADSFRIVGFRGSVYNTGILVWRLIDFGRVFLWMFVFTFIILNFKRVKDDRVLKQLAVCFVIVLISLSVSLVVYSGLSQHRYLMPVNSVFLLLTCYLLFEKLKSEKLKYYLYGFLLVGMLSGNLWIYPEKISVGWDATLAHLPYYNLREKMNLYLNENKIEFEKIGCDFPNLAEQKYLELNNDNRKHKEKETGLDEYILYSNIYNGFSDAEIQKLHSDFVLQKEFKQMGIFLRLYKRKR